jgi:acyl carrier protein
MKRCPEAAILAAIEFHRTKDTVHVATVVLGIIERFVEPGVRPLLQDGGDQKRLVEDLGIDSLLMVEIVMVIEETLGISIENEELRGLRTLGDVKDFLSAKLRGEPSPLAKRMFGLEQIAATMPHQPPFLFLQEVRLNGRYAEGTYAIRGDESFIEAHFPGDPVFPASLMIEALGQLAVFFILRADRPEFAEAKDAKVLFVSCDGVRCHRICRPGETLNLRVELSRVHLPIVQFSGIVSVGGHRVAKVEELSLGIYSGGAQESV